MGCKGLWEGVVPLFTGSYIHMNGQDTGHHSSPKFLSHLAPSATPWYTILAGRLNDARGDNITLITTDIPSTINTHNTELQMVKVRINNNKHITIANIYIPPRDSTSTHYKTTDVDIQHCIQYITNIPHSVITGDESAHSTLWHSYTDDNRGQLIADIISNSDHISLNTNTPTRVPSNTLQQT